MELGKAAELSPTIPQTRPHKEPLSGVKFSCPQLPCPHPSMGRVATALPSVPIHCPPGLGRVRQGEQWQTTCVPKLACSPVVTGVSLAVLPQHWSRHASSLAQYLPFSFGNCRDRLRNRAELRCLCSQSPSPQTHLWAALLACEPV